MPVEKNPNQNDEHDVVSAKLVIAPESFGTKHSKAIPIRKRQNKYQPKHKKNTGNGYPQPELTKTEANEAERG
jgi:hypothetical protein